jgi:ribonuclease PH
VFIKNNVKTKKMQFKRSDNRAYDQIRPVKITPDYLSHPEGSALIEMGNTRVICAASVQEDIPAFLKNNEAQHGWITCEYGMLPRATETRNIREATRGKASGRTHEIQRIIGRSLRAVTDLASIGMKTIWIDCDVIQADGGTRTAAITGAFFSLIQAFRWMLERGLISTLPVKNYLAAISVGIVHQEMLLDLNYQEDFLAEVDMNIAMTSNGDLVEIQATAEENPFSIKLLDELLMLARKGINELIDIQHSILGDL